MAGKLVVTADEAGSRVAIVGVSGRTLMESTYTDPRHKGAAVRALRSLMPGVVVEDPTTARAAKSAGQ